MVCREPASFRPPATEAFASAPAPIATGCSPAGKGQFGDARQRGYAELAQHDGNGDAASRNTAVLPTHSGSTLALAGARRTISSGLEPAAPLKELVRRRARPDRIKFRFHNEPATGRLGAYCRGVGCDGGRLRRGAGFSGPGDGGRLAAGRAGRRLRMKWLFVVAALIAAGVVAYRLRYPSQTIRYRITVEVNTPEGVRSGSGVWEARVWRQPAIMGAPEVYWGGSGDAVVVDLPNGKALFALVGVTGQNVVRIPERAANFAPVQSDGQYWKLLRNSNQRYVLPDPEKSLQFATFADINRPETVSLVRPGDWSKEKLAGAELTRVVIEFVDEDVTRYIEERLPWFQRYMEQSLQLDGSQRAETKSDASWLSAGNFRIPE